MTSLEGETLFYPINFVNSCSRVIRVSGFNSFVMNLCAANRIDNACVTFLHTVPWVAVLSHQLLIQQSSLDSVHSIPVTFPQDLITELDCLVYGHLNAIFMTKLPSYRMKRALGLHSRLIEYCKYVESKHGLRAQRERS